MATTCDGQTVYIDGASTAVSVKEILENKNASTPMANFRVRSVAWSGQTAGHILNMTIGSASGAVSAVYMVSPANNSYLVQYFDKLAFRDLNIASTALSSGTVIITLGD